MDVYWLEQNAADVPGGDDWLADSERLCLGRLRIPKRRSDWRLGRWTAKLAVAAHLELLPDKDALREIEIIPDSSGAPSAFPRNRTDRVGISLSHRSGVAVCAVSTGAVAFGCDLELIEPHGEAFIADYFTTVEQRTIAEAGETDRETLVAALWSAKESALKALRTGLRDDTLDIDIRLMTGLYSQAGDIGLGRSCKWYSVQGKYKNDQQLSGWWQFSDRFVRTFVSVVPTGPPIFLQGCTTAIAAH
jgi:4'-phosphopantetheinyl transferase